MDAAWWAVEAACGAAVVAVLAARARAARGTVVLDRPGAGGARVVVRDRGRARDLELARDAAGHRRSMLQSRAVRDGGGAPVSGLGYVDGMHLAALAAQDDGRDLARALVVGGGAMLLPRQLVALHAQLVVDVVEIDPAVLEVARDAFGLEPHPRIAITIGDGRAFLEAQDDARYDLVAIDAFGIDTAPRRLASEAFFALCRAKLRPGGALAVNLAGTFAGPRGAILQRVFAGVRAAFGDARAHGVPIPGERPFGWLPGRHAATAAALRGPRNTIALARRDAALPAPEALARRAASLPPLAATALPALARIIALAHAPSAHVLAPLGDPPHDPDESLPVR